MAPRSELRTLNGLRHHLLTWDGAEPAIVLLHGFLDLSWSFVPFAEALRARRPSRIVAPDLRGHGATDWVAPGGYYHFPDYIADMHALLSSLPEPRWLVGHSMGGTIALLLAGAFPELVQRLVLIEGLGPPQHNEVPPDRVARWIREVNERRQRPPRVMASVEVARTRLMENNARLTQEQATLLAEKSTRAVDGGVVWSFDPLHRTTSPMPFQLEQLRAFLRNIACPTLLVDGAESGFGRFVEEDGRARDIRDVRSVSIPDAGHMIHQDQPELLADAISAFLAE